MTENKNASIDALNVHNGTYTVSHPERGHFTLKLYTVTDNGDLRGKRILSLLVGPDNVTNYRGVAFWDDAHRTANIWKRFRGREHIILDGRHWAGGAGGDGLSSQQKKIAIWADLVNRGGDGYWGQVGYEVLLEGRCVVCNRKLTDPDSIQLGIGPVCGGRS